MKKVNININKSLLALIDWCVFIVFTLISIIIDIVVIVKDFVPMFPGGTGTIIGVAIPCFLIYLAVIALAALAIIRKQDENKYMSHLMRLIAYLFISIIASCLLNNILRMLASSPTVPLVVELISVVTILAFLTGLLLSLIKKNNINFKIAKIAILIASVGLTIGLIFMHAWGSMVFTFYLTSVTTLANPEDQDMTGAPKGYVIPKPIAKVLNKHSMVENAEDQLLENEDADDYDD